MASRVRPNGDLECGDDVVDARELVVRATTSGGPGGQHANRTLSRVVVRFDPATSSLSDCKRALLATRHDGAYEVSSSGHRSQAANKLAALEELARRLERDLTPPKRRRATKPTRSSGVRRLDEKKRRGGTKAARRRPSDDD